MTHARNSAVLAAAPLHTGLLFGAVTVTVLAAGVIVLAMIAGNRRPQPPFGTGHHYDTRVERQRLRAAEHLRRTAPLVTSPSARAHSRTERAPVNTASPTTPPQEGTPPGSASSVSGEPTQALSIDPAPADGASPIAPPQHWPYPSAPPRPAAPVTSPPPHNLSQTESALADDAPPLRPGPSPSTRPRSALPSPSGTNARDTPFLVGAAAGVVALLGGIACLVLIAPVATDDTAAEAPDPLAATLPGECVAIPAPHASGGVPATIVPAPCDTLPANFRVLQTGSCTDPRVDREHRRTDRAGRELVHLCLAPDWQAGICYDVTDWHLPRKVDCARVGKKIIRITAVLPYTADAGACPRDGDGSNAVGWPNRGITLCMRGSDRPDE